jgi:pimeloyl-ACP methyl ester carboxylesterase
MRFRLPHVVPAVVAPALVAVLSAAVDPPSPGRLVDVGGHRIHLDCRGPLSTPTVVFENGLGDFSFDWALVTRELVGTARVCAYDRAGYAWSDPGPMPRTFAQLNLELHDALAAAGERPPFLLVGHSYGGAVARAYALAYPREVAGLVLVDSVFEDQRVPIAGHAVRLRDGARGRPIHPPSASLAPSARTTPKALRTAPGDAVLDPAYAPLPEAERRLHLWAQALPDLEAAEASQREWSAEHFAAWHAAPSDGTLGSLPLCVLTRAKGGYSDRLDVTAAELDRERLEGQARLARLSTRGRRILLPTGHAMHLEAPREVARAILETRRAAADVYFCH